MLVGCFAALLGVHPSLAETFTVNADGTGDYPTIQAALDAAANDDVVELTDGTFTGDGNRDVDFLGKTVVVMSASGDPEACVVDCEGSSSDPHRGFIFQTQEPQTAGLRGIQVTGGWVEGDPEGGAVLCDGQSRPTIEGCLFVGNEKAAIFCHGHSAPLITGCRFDQNAGHYGAGVSLEEGTATITDCVFTENAASRGAGVHVYASSATIEDCRFIGNTAGNAGGAIALLYGGSATMSRCTFEGNTAGQSGAVDLHVGTGTMEECTFVGNTAGMGGAISTSKVSQLAIRSCTFYDNTAMQASAIFGGEYTVAIENTVIAFNNDGPAIYNESHVTLICCNIFGNEGGDWVGGIEDQYGINGNISEDPLFCDPENGDLSLDAASPCAVHAAQRGV